MDVKEQVTNSRIFTCSACGSCCSHLAHFHGIYDSLDRGDGVCLHFDDTNRLCNIYDSRPEMCKVQEGYNLFSDSMTWNGYIEITEQACSHLQKLTCREIA